MPEANPAFPEEGDPRDDARGFRWSAADWGLRAFVVAYMSHSGPDRDKLTARDWQTLYFLADGYGEVNAQFAIEQSWDWSHVRDSTPAAVRRMARRLLTLFPE